MIGDGRLGLKKLGVEGGLLFLAVKGLGNTDLRLLVSGMGDCRCLYTSQCVCAPLWARR